MEGISIGSIAKIIGGQIDGDPSTLIYGPAKIEDGKPGCISFLGNPKYEKYIYTCRSSAILVSLDFEPKQEIDATLIRVPDVYTSLGILLQHFDQFLKDKTPPVIDPHAIISPLATIGQNVCIKALAVIDDDVTIGNNVTIYPHVYIAKGSVIQDNTIIYSGVKVYHDCHIGKNCIIHSNAVIGSDGFGFAPQKDGSYQKIPQLGQVYIGDHVEIGANTVVDRATMDQTRIEEGVKLDNLIQVGHNVTIASNTVIAAQTGIAGSTKIGERCMIGGQVGFAGHLDIANGTMIQAQSGLGQSVKKENTALCGTPAINYTQFFKASMVFKQLPTMIRELERLKRKVKEWDSSKDN